MNKAPSGIKIHHQRHTQHRNRQVLQRPKLRITVIHKSHFSGGETLYTSGQSAIDADRSYPLLYLHCLCTGLRIRITSSQIGKPRCQQCHHHILVSVVGDRWYHRISATIYCYAKRQGLWSQTSDFDGPDNQER